MCPDAGWGAAVLLDSPAGPSCATATVLEQLMAQPPDRVAFQGETGQLTFLELLCQASQLAAHLNENGVGPSDHVLVRACKNPASAIAIYAVLMAGASFVAVPTSLPVARVHAINHQAAITTVLGEDNADIDALCSSPVMWQLNYRVFLGELPAPCLYVEPAYPVPSSQTATIVFPHGSAAGSRGIVLSHAALLATLQEGSRRFGIVPQDRILGSARMGEASFLFDLFIPAWSGCASLLYEEASGPAAAWLAPARQFAATVWHGDIGDLPPAPCLPPSSAFEVLAWPERPSALRLCVAGRPGMPPVLPQAILSHWPQVRFMAVGTLPELSIWSASREAGDPRAPAILMCSHAHILDGQGQPPSPLVEGELYLGGPTLAQEYVNDRQATADRFIHHHGLGQLFCSRARGWRRPDGTVQLGARAALLHLAQEQADPI